MSPKPQTVLVTGVTRGIGAQILAQLFARPHKRVIAAVRDLDANPAKKLIEQSSSNDNHIVVQINSESDFDAQKAALTIQEQYGIDNIDLIIANAGIAADFAPILEVKADDVRRTMNINVVSSISLFQAFETLLSKSQNPRGRTPYTWGWTIVRTVYTPESDRIFPAAVEKINRWLAYYVNIQKADLSPSGGGRPWLPEPADELIRLLCNDLLQDREQLDGTDWGVIYDVFKRWIQDQGVEDDDFILRRGPFNVRYNSCIVIDEAALKTLNNLPENLPKTKENFPLTPGA